MRNEASTDMSTTTFEPIHVTHFSDELSARTSELLDEEGMLSEAALERLVRRIAARPDLWQPLVVVDRERRRYELLYDDDQVDIWVLSWMPGQKTGFHDHDRSTVALMCVQGELDEGSLTIGTDATLLRMTAGTIAPAPAATSTRSRTRPVSRPSRSTRTPPPLTCVGQYRADEQGRVRREPEHGRKELKDDSIAAPAVRVEERRG